MAYLAILVCLSLYLVPAPVRAQEEKEVQKARDVIVVTGVYEPIPLAEADRPVRVFEVRRNELVLNTFADLLKLDSSLDLRQRAPNGVQSDLSIRGAGFGQTLVLLNGLRLNDVQSGHHNLDLPVPLESVSQLEVLKGSGSTLYGSDAIGGVVNIITRVPETSEVRLRAAVGNFGTNQQRGSLTYAGSRLSEQLTFSRDFSSGFRPNRDYRNLSLASSTEMRSALGITGITLATNDRPFGAEQFYGNFNSWERTRTWFAGLRQGLGSKTEASFAFRRHTDLFVLYRDRPQVFTNRHAVESFQAAIRRREELGANVKLHYGLEGYRDAIESNNLGHHDRARGAGYVALDVRALQRFSFSLGIRDEIYGSGEHEWSPSISAGVWLAPAWKVRGSVSRAFRLPTYTDLYYQDPGNRGSADLRPEKAWSFEGGVDWNISRTMRSSVTVFQRREQDGIDYVRRSPAEIWRATNFQRLRFTGVEASFAVGQLELQYTGLKGAQKALGDLQSKYAFNYPVHSGVVAWQSVIKSYLVARTRVGVLQRYRREPYAVWDIYTAGARGRVRPFVQLTNLTGAGYEEIPGVAMPGRGIIGGVEIVAFQAN